MSTREDLFRVLYCSRNLTGETGQDDSEELNRILRSARVNNRECGITGALLFSAGYFAQVLEGPKIAIERTFERIQQDDRHNEVTVLDCSDIVSRDFPNWSMARVAPQSQTQEQRTRTALLTAMGHPSEAGQGVLELMRTLVIEEA